MTVMACDPRAEPPCMTIMVVDLASAIPWPWCWSLFQGARGPCVGVCVSPRPDLMETDIQRCPHYPNLMETHVQRHILGLNLMKTDVQNYILGLNLMKTDIQRQIRRWISVCMRFKPKT